jgi:hypothetical protein
MMRTLSRHTFSVVALAAVILLTGCGKKTLPKSKTVPVRGKITYKGEPASYVLVQFSPESGAGAEAKGQTDAEGNFELHTYSNTGENDGAVPGEYSVTILDFNPVQGKVPTGAKPMKVEGGQAKAPDIVEIKDGGNDDLKIEIP